MLCVKFVLMKKGGVQSSYRGAECDELGESLFGVSGVSLGGMPWYYHTIV